MTVSVRPDGSFVATLSVSAPRPRRCALITLRAAYCVPWRTPLLRLPAQTPPAYCSIVSVPTRYESGRVQLVADLRVGAGRDRVGRRRHRGRPRARVRDLAQPGGAAVLTADLEPERIDRDDRGRTPAMDDEGLRGGGAARGADDDEDAAATRRLRTPEDPSEAPLHQRAERISRLPPVPVRATVSLDARVAVPRTHRGPSRRAPARPARQGAPRSSD